MESAREVLKSVFGYDSFRPLQEAVIQNVLVKQDSLAVMPTGSGKSLCYQLPALLTNGLTVVVSPLISLMEDQVTQLRQYGISAAYLNSTLPPAIYQETMDWVRDGRVKLLYAAPETLLKPNILALLDACDVDCLTIDEAHCISQWGHDFRPEYRQLAAVRRRLPRAACIALTATATARVRQDILQSLDIPQANEFIASFDRDNLFLTVAPKIDMMGQMLTFLGARQDESGIIYCATRKQVDLIAQFLDGRGWSVRPYHAGLDDSTRHENQRAFIRDDVSIIVATVAFGMGINKPNVRFVLHVDLPKDIEGYYQQIGRAGRDGLRADCLLLFSRGDVSTINYFIRAMTPDEQAGARERLNAIVTFGETGDCRRQSLLRYFNETYQRDNCEMCDNCVAEVGEQVELTVLAQKFLSCVYRTGQLFGTVYVIDVLRGSQRKEIKQRRHVALSTYGIGADLNKQQWRHLVSQFVQQGLLHQDITHGGLQLTEDAWPVLRGEARVFGALETQQPDKRSLAPIDSNMEETLFELLRRRRKELADAANIPPYAVFPDRSLIEMASTFPQSQAAFAQIYGVGQAKLQRYASEFLPVLQAYCTEANLTEKIAAAPKMRPSDATTGARTYVIGDLVANGRRIEDVADELAIKPRTVMSHLLKYVRAGRSLPVEPLRASSALPLPEQTAVLAAFAELGPHALRPVFVALDERVAYDELHVLRLVYLAEQADASGS